MARFEVLAVNDSASFCECCGRSGLQRVVWIADHETGEHKHFGTSCALRPAKGFDCVAEIKTAIKRHTDAMKYAMARAYAAYKAAGGKFLPMNEAGEWDFADKALWNALKARESAQVSA